MEGLNDLEQAVLDKLLVGDHPVLDTLRVQAREAKLAKREYTGVGFFCDFEIRPDVPVVTGQGDFQIGEVFGKLEGLTHGAGFTLFIKGGRLEMLEGFTYGEPWPCEVRDFTLTYHKEPRELQFLDALTREE